MEKASCRVRVVKLSTSSASTKLPLLANLSKCASCLFLTHGLVTSLTCASVVVCVYLVSFSVYRVFESGNRYIGIDILIDRAIVRRINS